MLGKHGPLLLAAALVLGGLVASGCGKSSTAPSNATSETQNLNLSNGGFNVLAEQPGFGNQALVGSGTAEVAAADPLETTDQQVAIWATMPDSIHAYAVTLLWGILRKDPANRILAGNPGAGVVTDWNGDAAVNRGALVVRSTIAFENTDHVVLPRTNRMRIDWVSHTTDSYDGIRFWVYQPLPDGSDGSRDTLTIVAGAHTWTLLVNNLANMDTTYVTDQAGNRFAIQAFRVEKGSCVRGFHNGVWLLPTTTGGSGSIRGRVLGNHGEILGDLSGFFGTNTQGSRVLFAKYIDARGNFLGIVTGTWTDGGSETAETGPNAIGEVGSFQGELLDSHGSAIGAIRWAWHSRLNGTDGVFAGLWSIGCLN